MIASKTYNVKYTGRSLKIAMVATRYGYTETLTKRLSFCLVPLILAISFIPVKSYAISLIPHTDWVLTLDNKDISPASEAPGPPDGPLKRAEAKRAFGNDSDTGAASIISASNLTANKLLIKAYAKVTNDATKTDGVAASTGLKFSRIYKTKQVNSSGAFTVNMRGDIKGIDGKLVTINPFFNPVVSVELILLIREVDATGTSLTPFNSREAVYEYELLDNALKLIPNELPNGGAKPGDKHTDPGSSQRTLKNNFNGAEKYRKRTGETKYFRINGEFEVTASIDAVQSLEDRITALTDFKTFVELGAPGSLLSANALLARILELINLDTGILTTAGMFGSSEADFFSTVDLIIDTTDIIEFDVCFPIKSSNQRVVVTCL